MASNCEGLLDMLTRTFDSVIREFCYYKKYWSPKNEENLVSSHERNNVFDIFAIKTCKKDKEIVGYLPCELSCTLNLLLERGTKFQLF